MDLLLSVCLITYNHKKYIREAIEGVLMQQVNFPYELIIADDFSTDGTREIVIEYQQKYPDLIKLILQEKNVGAAQNWMDLISAPKSKYIAYFEGDDYWAYPNKLQKQIDFLEANPLISGCFHDVATVDKDSKVINENYHEAHQKIYNQFDSLTHGGSYATCSLVFRSYTMKNLPKWFVKAACDYTMDLLITEFGDIAHINENMGAYRIHAGGLWQGKSENVNNESIIPRYKACLENPKFKKQYGNFFYKRISELSLSLSLYYQSKLNISKSIKYASSYLIYTRPKNIKFFKILFTGLLFPAFYLKFKYLLKRLLSMSVFGTILKIK